MHVPSFLLRPLIRRKARLHATPIDRYQVRIARTVREYEDASRLVHAAYVYHGIKNVQADELRITPQQLLPESSVLVAYEGDRLVGTMTVAADSPAGLPLDKDYVNELDALRQRGHRLVEYTSYAIVERCWHSGVSNLLYLAATALANSLGTHVVVGVHPRASAFYHAVFNFRPIGAPREHAELCAPVIGIMHELAALNPFLLRHYRKPMASGHLPVEHFFGLPLACVRLRSDATERKRRSLELVHSVSSRRVAASASLLEPAVVVAASESSEGGRVHAHVAR